MHGSITAALLAAALSSSPAENKIPDRSELERLTARFKPVEISADLSRVPAEERAVLATLVQAARIIDALFFRQVWAGNQTLMFELAQDWSPLGWARLHALLVNKGP